MTPSATLSPRMVTHRMVENLAKTRADAETAVEKSRRGRKPKAQSTTANNSENTEKPKRGRPKKQGSEIAVKKTRKGKPGPKPKASTAESTVKTRKKPGPKPKTATAAKRPYKRRNAEQVDTSSTNTKAKRSDASDAVVTVTISGSAAAIKRALADLQS